MLTRNNLTIAALGLVAAVLVIAAVSGRKLPLLSSDRAIFAALTVVGLGMCTLGMQLGTYGWKHPVNIAGSVLGALLLVFAGLVLAGVRLPFISSDRVAILVLAGLGLLKVALAVVRPLPLFS